MVDLDELRANFARKRLSQKQVAQYIGISEKTMVERMQRGNFSIPEATLLIELLDLENPQQVFFKGR